MPSGDLKKAIQITRGQESLDVLKKQESLEKRRNEIKEKYRALNRKDIEIDEKRISQLIANEEEKRNKLTRKQRTELYTELAKVEENHIKKLSLNMKAAMNATLDSLVNIGTSALSKTTSGVDQYISSYSNYMSQIDARLQGSTKSFKEIADVIRGNVGISPYVKQTDILKKIDEAVDKGIAYNVEQRAFLATVSKDIATTFDAFNSNLSRIIRIQQADSTAARLGLEAQLTQFFNNTFGDTSYLSTLFDTVSANLLSAQALLGKKESVSFEYNVQKWLGSLSSVGVSDSTISSLSQAIGYLASGNISQLTSNTQMQSLLAVASQYAGLDYGTFFERGASAEDVNKLLKGITTFAQTINEQQSLVARSKLAETFGFDITDLVALTNLSTKDLTTISNNILTYQQAENETQRQLGLLGGRLSIAQQIQNVFDNVMAGIGENIAGSALQYGTWLAADMLTKSGDINIPVPFVGTIGVGQTTKSAMVLGNLVATLIQSLGNLGQGGLSLTGWNASQTTQRGTGFTSLITTGTSQSTSATSYIGNTSQSALYESSLAATPNNEQIIQSQENQNELLEIVKMRIAEDLASILSELRNGVKLNDQSFYVLRNTI